MSRRGSWGWVAFGLIVVIMPVMFWNRWKTMKSHKSVAEMKSFLKETPVISRGLSGVMAYIRMFRKPAGSTPRLAPHGVNPTPNPSQKIPVQAPNSPVLLLQRPSVSTAIASAPMASAAKPQEPVWYNPKTDRDPTLSPIEQRRAERMRYLESHPTEPASAKPGRGARLRVHQAPIERRIKLTAIVVTAESTRAIVNDAIMKVGDNVLGARIVRITKNKVFFRYKDRQFVKAMPKE